MSVDPWVLSSLLIAMLSPVLFFLHHKPYKRDISRGFLVRLYLAGFLMVFGLITLCAYTVGAQRQWDDLRVACTLLLTLSLIVRYRHSFCRIKSNEKYDITYVHPLSRCIEKRPRLLSPTFISITTAGSSSICSWIWFRTDWFCGTLLIPLSTVSVESYVLRTTCSRDRSCVMRQRLLFSLLCSSLSALMSSALIGVSVRLSLRQEHVLMLCVISQLFCHHWILWKGLMIYLRFSELVSSVRYTYVHVTY